uniref:Uncharacterized protein n=1 Tax=Anguilla anguilla TaxID=7936 RepID=A0A0E9X4R3_ANGAN
MLVGTNGWWMVRHVIEKVVISNSCLCRLTNWLSNFRRTCCEYQITTFDPKEMCAFKNELCPVRDRMGLLKVGHNSICYHCISSPQ